MNAAVGCTTADTNRRTLVEAARGARTGSRLTPERST